MAVFADILLDYFNSGRGTPTTPYGFRDPTSSGFLDGPNLFDQEAINSVLGDDPGPGLDALSLPTDSFVTVGFTSGFAIDAPGNDIFIRESGAAGDRANVFVSTLTNPTASDFVFLGVAQDDVTTSFDLAAIGFTQPVRAIKVVGLDNNGTSPGFDVVNVQALQVLTSKGDRIFNGTDDADILVGGNGNDILTGNNGNDSLVGKLGKDTLIGGDGDDKLSGGKGDDMLIGSSGSDRISCGQGKDMVMLERGLLDRDVIRDFVDRQDKLALTKGTQFSKLRFEQKGNNTIVSFRKDQLAVLIGVEVNIITSADFKFV
jgi:Ca2+-binding RTX toxin-like protein